MARAPLLTWISLSATLRSSLPETMTFAASALRDTMPAACSAARSISVACRICSAPVRTSAMSSRVGELKPRLGRRRCNGIWPPSKPSLWKPPERAFWPLWPRPAVLPQPEPTPRPTRWRSFFEPGAGLSELSRIDSHQVVDLVDHAAHRRRVRDLDRLIDLFQAQAAHRRAMRLLDARDAAQQRHLDLLHAVISSTRLPRRAAISAGVLIDLSPLSVARTTLYGLVEPKHLASTLVTPITSNTARIGPPAMMPVPSCAGCISTRAAPWRPFTTWCSVPFFSLTLNSLRRASSIAFCTATGTSRALPMPMPPSPSPTTVSAAKPSTRPPFTTLVTRLTAIIFSRSPSPRSSPCCILGWIFAINPRQNFRPPARAASASALTRPWYL